MQDALEKKILSSPKKKRRSPVKRPPTERQLARNANLVEVGRAAKILQVNTRLARITAALEHYGAMSLRELVDELDEPETTIKNGLQRLRGVHPRDPSRPRTVRIAYHEPKAGSGLAAPMYALGSEPDAKRRTMSHKTHGKRYRAKYAGLVKLKNRMRQGLVVTMWDGLKK
jgi:hypothetical protein